ncbi:MAG: FG-GAP-like repeat-containing protein [Saprospiraceae bacterium]
MLKHPYFLRVVTAFIFLFSFSAISAQVEDCFNGIDDDGDGLIDCFDPDCTCTGQCDDFYYATCGGDCSYVPPCAQLSLGVQWIGEAETGTYSPLVAGDMDGDGIPEIVTYWVENPDIYIIDGVTGLTKVHIVGATPLPGGTAPAIADLDNDGFGEIVIVGQDRRLRCYEHDGTLKFASPGQVGFSTRYRFSIPNIGDVDHDGFAEINIGNQIFSGQTGALLCSAPDNTFSAGEHPKRVVGGFSFNSPVLMDVLPDAFCADCAGLEIVAGNTVFSVNLVTGVSTPQVMAPAGYSDGFTGIADFDRDGDLDGVVQGERNGENCIYVWDLQTSTILREFIPYENWALGASRPNIADLDGDGELEVSFVEYPRLYALDNDFTPLWINNTSDVSSVTCSSVFDFCGDGSSDVIYRGQTKLQVLEGATGLVKWEDDCVSATHIENPLVLDVDADGQTEIVIECSTDGTQNVGSVVVFEAVASPGIASRTVWNQHAYFNTNINDDLRVPLYQQNPHIVGDSLTLNGFLNQFFNPSFPTPDGTIALDNVLCVGDSLDISLSICNNGDNLLPPQTLISFYQGNPQTTAAPWLGALPISVGLLPDSCASFTFRVPRVANDSIFLVLNDDHSLMPPFNLVQDFPVTGIGECEFANNIDVFYYDYTPDEINLGPDTLLCGDQTLDFDITGNQLSGYTWQDGSMLPQYTVPGPGFYFASAIDQCGIVHSDTLVVTLDTSTVVRLGMDQEICEGETFQLGETGFDYYTWSPSGLVDCPTCASVIVDAPSSGFVALEAGFADGCKSTDTVFIQVNAVYDYTIDTVICYGRVVDWFGTIIPPDSLHVFNLQTTAGCDSTVRINVIGTTVGTYTISVDTNACLGTVLPYNGFDLEPGENTIFNLSAITGCDSTVLVYVAPLDTFATAEDLVICYGDTALVFGQPVATSGIYLQTFTAANGCDSTHTVGLQILDPILISIDETPTCFNESIGTLQANVQGGAMPYAYAWDWTPGMTSEINGLPAGNYELTVTDANDCTETAAAQVSAYPEIQFSVDTDTVSCYGVEDGAILVSSPDPTLTYSLDYDPFLQTEGFYNLAAGEYDLLVQDVFGCMDTLEMVVFGPPPLQVVLPADTVVQLGDSLPVLILNSSLTPVQYTWNDTSYLSCTSCENPWAYPLSSIIYELMITDENGCTATDTWNLQVDEIINLFMPNVFSLSALNDFNQQFRPAFGKAVRRVNVMQIYDRWGALLYEVKQADPTDSILIWDGRSKGKYLDPGVYIWILELELVDGRIIKKQGDVTLIR